MKRQGTHGKAPRGSGERLHLKISSTCSIRKNMDGNRISSSSTFVPLVLVMVAAPAGSRYTTQPWKWEEATRQCIVI